MHPAKRVLAAATFCLGLASCAGKRAYLLDFIDESKATGKPLVVEFYADWCQPCKIFETKVLPDPRVQQELGKVLFVRYDMERGAGRDAAARCQVKSVPTFVGIDPAGKVRLLKKGTESTPEEFLRFLAETQEVLATRPPGR